MNDELNFYLRGVPQLLRNALSKVENHVSGSGNLEDIPTETIYEDFIQTAEDIITAADFMVHTLEIMAENLDLPDPGPIPGARLKPRLAFTHADKNKITRFTLISARQILRSHFDTVHPLAADIADICYEHFEEQN